MKTWTRKDSYAKKRISLGAAGLRDAGVETDEREM